MARTRSQRKRDLVARDKADERAAQVSSSPPSASKRSRHEKKEGSISDDIRERDVGAKPPVITPDKTPKKDTKKESPVREAPSSKRPIVNPYKPSKKIVQKTPPSVVQEVNISRAPVLTLWVALVAERQGFTSDEAYTYAKWVTATLAQSKGRSLGIYEHKEVTEEERAARRHRDEQLGVTYVEAFGNIKIPVILKNGKRLAASGGSPVDPAASKGYVQRAFGENLNPVMGAMRQLTYSMPPEELRTCAYHLYERFRPEWRGWGVKGVLHLDVIRGLADTDMHT